MRRCRKGRVQKYSPLVLVLLLTVFLLLLLLLLVRVFVLRGARVSACVRAFWLVVVVLEQWLLVQWLM